MSKFGHRHTKSAKVTPSMVMDIRLKYQEGMTQSALSQEYHLSIVQIGRIVRNESWQSLPATTATPEELQLMALRSAEVAKEVQISGKMEGDISAAREKDKAADKMLEELKGPPVLDEVKKRAKEFLG